MKKRIISAIVALLIVVPLIILGGNYFIGLSAVLSILAYKELLDLVNNANENNFNFLNQTEQIKIYAWKTIDLVSNKIPGIIMFFMFKEEF